MRLSLAGLLLFASTAVAQTTTVPSVAFTTPSSSAGTTITISKADCGNSLRFNWVRSGNICGGNLEIYATTTSCGVDPILGDLKLVSLTNASATSGVVDFSVEEFLAAKATAQDAATAKTCDTQDAELSIKVCASARLFGGGILGTDCAATFSSVGAPAYVVEFDPVAPTKPSIGSVIARDSALSIPVNGVEDSSAIVVDVTALSVVDAGTLPDEDAGVDAGDDGGTTVEPVPVGATRRFRKASGEGNVVADGLVNGVTYRLEARIIDEAGNTSDPSDPAEGTPVKSNGLFDAYRNANGQEEGGCASTGGGIAGGAVLAVLGIWLSSRRKVS